MSAGRPLEGGRRVWRDQAGRSRGDPQVPPSYKYRARQMPSRQTLVQQKTSCAKKPSSTGQRPEQAASGKKKIRLLRGGMGCLLWILSDIGLFLPCVDRSFGKEKRKMQKVSEYTVFIYKYNL